MADPPSPSGGTVRPLAPGTKVEVRRRYDNRWAQGFEVAAVEGDGYLVRRRSDGSVIPTPFTRADVRRERQSDWWF